MSNTYSFNVKLNDSYHHHLYTGDNKIILERIRFLTYNNF